MTLPTTERRLVGRRLELLVTREVSMDWKTTYPTVADVNAASIETLFEWEKCLPDPQTDVERTVRKRIDRRLMDYAGAECREKAPEIAEKWNDLMGMCEKLGIPNPGKM